MIDGKKIIVVTPAGRKCYLEILIKYILRLKGIVDEYHLWLNTNEQSDVEYIKSIADDYIKVIEMPGPCGGGAGIARFFVNCTEPNTVYVRFDDDIVFLDENEAFINFVKFRIAHPEYFVVYSNIINNAITSHLHQRFGNINNKCGYASYDCLCDKGWNNPKFAENVHREFLSKKSKDFYFDKWILHLYERVSINCISWLGEEFAKFNGMVGHDEEQWISCDKPFAIKKPNCIYGGFVCAHYAFYTQRPHMQTTDILDLYASKINDKLE
ncbi:MAG: hypothetical protein EBU66_19985 [Bacteroidetes bacterium]|nr:hypothetical protein [Bacteroidota bacterium]